MSGFYVLDLAEFRPLVDAARRHRRCQIHDAVGGYWFVEFAGEIEIRRADTGLGPAIWFGCLTAGLDGKITAFDGEFLRLASTNAPVLGAEYETEPA